MEAALEFDALRLRLPTKGRKIGWRVKEWAEAVGISRASVYELIASKEIDSVKFGGARIIRTQPDDFLASLPAA